MRQTWHIFRKDLRYLRREIGLVVALAGLFVWVERRSADPSWVELLLIVAFCYLIARLVHAEAIPGDRQFWITRPYRWKSLLGAKVLFLLLFVNLPVSVGQWQLVIGKFPLAHTLPGLLWSQVLLLTVFTIPVAALATLTRSIASFIFTALVLLALGFSAQQMIWLPLHVTPRMNAWPEPITWVRHLLGALILIITTLATFYLQYKYRRTNVSRALGVTAVAITAGFYFYLPFPVGYAVQSRISKEPQAAATISVALEAPQGTVSPHYQGRGQHQIRIRLPFAIRGVPDGMSLRPDGIQFLFEGSDGLQWKSRLVGAKNLPGYPGVHLLEGIALLDPAFFRAETERPVTLRAALYLTLFGHTREQSIDLRRGSATLAGQLRCGSGDLGYVACQSSFRWPALLVYTASPGREMSSFNEAISYSPFPAEMSLNPIESHWAFGALSSNLSVTIVTKEPLAHMRRDVVVQGVRLKDLAGRTTN